MVDFRRVITALAMLALFVGLASAQVGGSAQSPLTCTTNVTVTPALRGEGYTEQTGDIAISCTGGSQLAVGSNIPLVNIQVFYNSTVTSRLLPVSSPPSTSQTPSEALLLIDEPGSGLIGFGPSLPQLLCTTPYTGCAAQVGAANYTPVNPGTQNQAPNVYQGMVTSNGTGNSVTFFGVPVLPPTTTAQRVYRITNVRINATALAGGSASGASAVIANISISGATSVPISNSNPNVGFVSNGLTASASAGGINQCTTATKASVSTLTFTENFGTAFKTRVAATANTLYNGQINNPAQNIPGGIYNSESNFVFPIPGSSSQVAGLADFGTRLKATFNSIPANAKVFVSVANVNNNAFPVTAPSPIGGSGGNGGAVGYAQLVTGENVSDGNVSSGFFPAVTATDNGPNNGNVPVAEVSIVNGTGTAVWEVVNTNPNTIESFKFAVYMTVPASQNNVSIPAATVSLSYAPTATSGVASSSLSIPRFAGDSSAPRTIANFNICRTILLYPFITNQAGFDTGLTVANTTNDPFTTGSNATLGQSGTCKLNWYGSFSGTATPAVDTPNITPGTVWANTLQAIAPGFQGYMFAVCNFQFAHGFAFISDVGARNIAMGYLAVVLNDPGSNALANVNTTTSENGGH